MEERVYIYQTRGIKDTTTAQLKCIGYIAPDQDFKDEPMDYKGKTLSLYDNSVSIKFYRSNINQGYMLNNKKLPIMYASVTYNKPLVTGHLFNIHIMFEITSDTSQIKTVTQLLSTPLTGKYYIEIDIDDKKDTIDIVEFAGYKETADNLMAILSSDSMIDIIKQQLKKRDEERIKKWGSPADYKVSVPKYNFGDLVKRYEKGENIEEIIKNTV